MLPKRASQNRNVIAMVATIDHAKQIEPAKFENTKEMIAGAKAIAFRPAKTIREASRSQFCGGAARQPECMAKAMTQPQDRQPATALPQPMDRPKSIAAMVRSKKAVVRRSDANL